MRNNCPNARRVSRWLGVSAVALALAACGGTATHDSEPASDANYEAPATLSTGLVDGSKFDGHPLDDPNSLLSTRVVYFAFDSSQLRAEDQAVVEAHASYLATNPGARVSLEGHADERGTREYNLALGEQRSVAVNQVMRIVGVGTDQVELVSYGEERPVDAGHSEGAWSQNRRVEFNYTAR